MSKELEANERLKRVDKIEIEASIPIASPRASFCCLFIWETKNIQDKDSERRPQKRGISRREYTRRERVNTRQRRKRESERMKYI